MDDHGFWRLWRFGGLGVAADIRGVSAARLLTDGVTSLALAPAAKLQFLPAFETSRSLLLESNKP